MIVSYRAEVEVVGIQTFGRLAHGALGLGLLEFRCNRADHARRHAVLKFEYVFEDAVRMVRPQMAACRSIDELAADAQTVGRLAYRPLQNVAHAQFAADLSDVDRLTLVGKARIAGDY